MIELLTQAVDYQVHDVVESQDGGEHENVLVRLLGLAPALKVVVCYR
jgi:hypothetical protein